MARGRKRKPGKRTASGQLSRAGIPAFDRGTERAQAMQTLYGQDGCDALGRAFHSGLLGEGSEAKALLDLGRAISNAYWAMYSTGRITCALGDRTSGSVVDIDQARAKKREDWLNACLRYANSCGERHRRSFHQLVIDVNPDCGPRWLDNLCGAGKRSASVEDLDRALFVLRELAT